MPIINTPAIRQVARTIDRYAMMAAGDKVLVAVSGGADSAALLHILVALADNLGISLGVAHLNHGLRGRAADNDARFVENMAGRLNLRFHGRQVRLDPSAGSLEASGRQARYAFFNHLAETQGYTKIALGHHMEDNAEAVLLHLLRGSGIRGLSGIPPVRRGRIVRPLMELRRAEIIGFVRDQRIAYVEDASNAELRFDRNRIRHLVIPFIQKQFDVDLTAVLNRTADLCRQEDIWLQELLEPSVNQAMASLGPDCMQLLISSLEGEPLAVQRRIIREALRKWRSGIKGIGVEHIDSLIRLLQPGQKGKRVCLPGLIGVERSRTHLTFGIRRGRGFPSKRQIQDYNYKIPFPGSRLLVMDIPESGHQFEFCMTRPQIQNEDNQDDAATAWFDADKIDFPLSIRNFKPGDRMTLSGMQGHQKLKKLFGDRKIPLSRRHTTPLLISANDIIWVAGIRRSALAIPTGSTKHILKVRMNAGSRLAGPLAR